MPPKHSPKRNRQRGKELEREISKLLGGKRIGILGCEDIEHPVWSIETKERKRLSIEAFMLQAERNTPIHKTPLLVLHQLGKEHKNDIVCMRLKDFQEWHGGGEK